jgi:hypothetical protein
MAINIPIYSEFDYCENLNYEKFVPRNRDLFTASTWGKVTLFYFFDKCSGIDFPFYIKTLDRGIRH